MCSIRRTVSPGLGILLIAAGCCLPAGGFSQYATLIRQFTLDDQNGQTPPLQDSWWGTYGYGKSGYSPGRTFGMVQKDLWEGTKVDVVLHEVSAFGTWTTERVKRFTTSSVDYPSVAYDNACIPHVFIEQSSTRYHCWRENGVWMEEVLVFDLTPFFDGEPGTSLSLIQGLRGLDGNIHLLFTARKASGQPTMLFQATSVNGWGWSLRNCGEYRTALASGNFALEEIYNYAVDHSGNLHLGFGSSEPWGDPNNLPRQRLNWANFSGAWYSEVVIQGPNVDNKPSTDGFLALDGNASPHMLGTYTRHATTGSMQSSTLYYYRRTGTNSWAQQTVAAQSDNYNGGDGTAYTGIYPQLFFDGHNRPHVTFSDFSSWHWRCIEDMPSISCNDTIRGQLRYAYTDDSGAWRLTTLYHQLGQSASPNPLNMFEGSTLAVSPGGRWVHAFGMEHIHHSHTYAYDQDATREYKVIYFQVENPLGTDGSSTHTAQPILNGLLGLAGAGPSLDLNGDGNVDSADLKKSLL